MVKLKNDFQSIHQMNKNSLRYKVVFLPTFLMFLLLVGDQTMACLFPSLSEMGQGKAMDCCTKHCRMDTTPQAAQEACQESSQVFSQQDTISNPIGASSLTIFKSLSDFDFQAMFHPPALETLHLLPKVLEHRFQYRYKTVEIFNLNQTFLI